MPKFHLSKLTPVVCWTILTYLYQFSFACTGLFCWNALNWFSHNQQINSSQWCPETLYKNARAMQIYQFRAGRELKGNKLVCSGLGLCVFCVFLNCSLTWPPPLVCKDRFFPVYNSVPCLSQSSAHSGHSQDVSNEFSRTSSWRLI